MVKNNFFEIQSKTYIYQLSNYAIISPADHKMAST